MKKKNKTYILLGIVCCIWGIIIYKIVGSLDSPSENVVHTVLDDVFTPKQVNERELFSINLDYRDPFLGTVETPRKHTSQKKVIPVQKKEVPAKSIQFTGLVERKNSAQKIFFITIDGQQQMMKLNETFREVKLIKGSKNAIRVKYNGKTQTINRTK